MDNGMLKHSTAISPRGEIKKFFSFFLTSTRKIYSTPPPPYFHWNSNLDILLYATLPLEIYPTLKRETKYKLSKYKLCGDLKC